MPGFNVENSQQRCDSGRWLTVFAVVSTTSLVSSLRWPPLRQTKRRFGQ